MSRKIVLFELNEVPWRVLLDHVEAHPAGALARLVRGGRCHETWAEDGALSPWVTWPTLHRGVTDERHGISDLGQDLAEIDRAFPPVWELLAAAGARVGVFGSLHSWPPPEDPERYAFYVPDVFATGSRCHPRSFEPFQELNLTMSRASARNVSTSIPWAKALRFLAAAPSLGLTLGTTLELGKHLAEERVARWTRVRRRTQQSVLAFDLFLRQLRRARPDFATFFTNHVASAMHRFWAARYPGDYDEFDCPPEWVETYRGEIDWAMQRADAMLARLLDELGRRPEYELWVASSMGQEATEARLVRSQVYLEDVATFMGRLGVPAGAWERRPAMLPRVIVHVDEARAEAFARELDEVRISGLGSLPWHRLDATTFRIHVELQNATDETCTHRGERLSFAALGLADVPVQDASAQTAYHVPSGTLIRFDPQRQVTDPERSQISTCDVVPRILERMGVARPDHLRVRVAS